MRSALGCLALLATTLILIAAPVPKEKAKVKDEEAILGTWAIEKYDNCGEQCGPPLEAVLKTRVEFKKDGKTKVHPAQGGEVKEGEYKLDPSAKVKTIDLIDEGRTTLGIYELDGDTLKICIREGENATRPEELKPDGNKAPVVTLKRVKDEAKEEKKDAKEPKPEAPKK